MEACFLAIREVTVCLGSGGAITKSRTASNPKNEMWGEPIATRVIGGVLNLPDIGGGEINRRARRADVVAQHASGKRTGLDPHQGAAATSVPTLNSGEPYRGIAGRRHMLQRIVLQLARTHDFPEESGRYGYEIVAPLLADGRLDGVEWCSIRVQCRVKRFWGEEPDLRGVLVHRPGGSGGATWMIDYDRQRADDDEAGYRLGTHAFRVGEYVSIRDADGDLNIFKVVEVRPAAAQMAKS
jgi:hypothetical protein